MKPINQLINWISEERQHGVINPQQAVLSTTTSDAIPHARVVAVREINEDGLLFFTQKGTRKVVELQINPRAAMTFWFEVLQREVIIEGTVNALLAEENERYWSSYPREAQIRFHSYAATSSQPISSKMQLEEKKRTIEKHYHGKELPMNEFYCGFRFVPQRLIFYAYRTDELSDVDEYLLSEKQWIKRCLSP